MASCCKGICLNYKHTSLPNGMKYTTPGTCEFDSSSQVVGEAEPTTEVPTRAATEATATSSTDTESTTKVATQISTEETTISSTVCTFQQLDGPVEEKGNAVGYKEGLWLHECENLCIDNIDCQSFVYEDEKEAKFKGGCYLKDKVLDGTEGLIRESTNIFSVRKICEKSNRKYFNYKIELCSSRLYCDLL